MVKVLTIDTEDITICADTDDIRPHFPCVYFMNRHSDIKIVFRHEWQRNQCFDDNDWCDKVANKMMEIIKETQAIFIDGEDFF